MLKLVLDCDVDVAWRALRSPAVLRELYSPMMGLEALDAAGFPTVWEPGAHRVRVKAAGAVPLGDQIIDLEFLERRDGTRILHDQGDPITGPLSKLAGWDHQMAVSRDKHDPTKTLYRDRLEISGAVAPALWYLVFGLPGLLAYKMLNTADSMIGHKSERYVDFGWASARLDDLANWPAARLSIALIAAGAWLRRGGDACREAFKIAMRDGGMHRSPNSGRPEAAMAGALNVQLAGPRVYSGVVVMEPMINGGGRETAVIEDIESAVSVFYASCSVLAFVALVIFLFLL